MLLCKENYKKTHGNIYLRYIMGTPISVSQSNIIGPNLISSQINLLNNESFFNKYNLNIEIISKIPK